MLEMSVVDMSVDSKQSLEDYFDNVDEIFGERYSESAGEDFFIIQLVLHPSH